MESLLKKLSDRIYRINRFIKILAEQASFFMFFT